MIGYTTLKSANFHAYHSEHKYREEKVNIINDKDIDEIAARDYLAANRGVELFPRIPENITVYIAAKLLHVSEPTIERMVADGQITLTKAAITAYIERNYLANRPINLTQNTRNQPK